jgi:Rrf2 family protein
LIVEVDYLQENINVLIANFQVLLILLLKNHKMDLSNTSKLAIRSVVYISSQMGKSKYVNINEIVENVEENGHTVRKVLQILVKHSIINSLQGSKGGFAVSKEQMETPIIQIVQTIEGLNKINSCILGLSKCTSKQPCPLHEEYQKAKAIIHKILMENTIADLTRMHQTGQVHLKS